MSARHSAVSWRQPLIHPVSRCSVLKVSQLTLSFLPFSEDNAVMKSVCLALPELNAIRLDNVAAPVSKVWHKHNVL